MSARGGEHARQMYVCTTTCATHTCFGDAAASPSSASSPSSTNLHTAVLYSSIFRAMSRHSTV